MYKSETDTQELKVTFLDDFKITYKDKELSQKSINSDKVTRLLAYLICHKENVVSVGELSDVLWTEGECDDPANALKNLVYRARSVLKSQLGINPIKTLMGSYCWNDNVNTVIDTEQFEKLCNRAECEPDIKERISYSAYAIDIYKKKFFNKYSYEYWVVTFSVYYHSRYLEVVKNVLQDLYGEGDYDRIEQIGHRDIMIDGLDEDIQFYYIKSLIAKNKIAEAAGHYEKVKDLLKEQLNVSPGRKLMELYNQLLIMTHSARSDIRTVRRELYAGRTALKGALFCDYNSFKKSFELELRRRQRSNCFFTIVLVTVNGRNSAHIKNTLLASLREGDLISQYNKWQYVIMLTQCDYNNALVVVRRIKGNLRVKKLDESIEYAIERIQ